MILASGNDIGTPHQVRHGCEKNLTQQFSDYHDVICKTWDFCFKIHIVRGAVQFFRGTGTENECFNISFVDIPEHEATFADVCFCNEDK